MALHSWITASYVSQLRAESGKMVTAYTYSSCTQGRIQDFVKAGVLISHTLNHTHSHTQSTEEKLSCDSFIMGRPGATMLNFKVMITCVFIVLTRFLEPNVNF